MKRLLTLLLLAVIISVWARADLGGYTLRHVTINAVVHENSKWDITETLEVEFFEPRHGIYKYVPSRFHYAFTQPDGTIDEKVYTNKVSNFKVNGYDYELDIDETPARNKIIKIGSADEYVEGLQTYVITYQVQYFDDRFVGEDFLCHTIWGDGWETEVDVLDFSIKFDKPLPESFAHDLNVYSGPRGSTVNLDSVQVNYDRATNTITGHASNMGMRHAVTLSSQLPEAYWQPETKSMFLFYIMVVLLVVAAAAYVYKVLSHKHSKPVPTVAFYPPDGMSSAEVGKIIDGSTDTIDLASLIPWLAHRGYLTIQEVPTGRNGKKVDLVLTRKVPLLPKAPRYQTAFMNAIFGNKNTVSLNNLGDRHVEMSAAQAAIDKSFTGKRELTNMGAGVGYWILTLLAALGVLTTASITDWFDWMLPFYGVFSSVGAAFIIGLTRVVNASKRYVKTTFATALEITWCLLLVVLGTGLQLLLVDEGDICFPVMWLTVGSVALSAMSFMLNRCLIDTDYRVKTMGELLGLRDFIKTAELPRLKMLVDENPSYFYDVLPYAMVFGLSDKWAKQFESITIGTPDWYTPSYSDRYVSPWLMATAISTNVANSITSAVRSASIDPTSSSSSGGYSGGGRSFSGGGGGGGGGGSW